MANKLSSETAAQAGDGRELPRDHNKPPTLIEMLTSELTDTYRLEFEKVEPIRTRANAREQKIESDEDLAAWTVIFTEAKALHSSLDAARLTEQRPFQQVIKETFEPRLVPLTRIMDWIKDRADKYNRAKLQKQREQEAAERTRLDAIAAQARKDAEIAAEFGDAGAVVEHVQQAAAAQEQIQQQAAPSKVADVARVRADTGTSMSTAAAVWKFEIADYSKVDLNSLRLFFTPAEVDKAVGKLVKQQKGATKVEGVRVYEDVGTKFKA